MLELSKIPKYYEYEWNKFTADVESIIRSIIPSYLAIGGLSHDGDVAFRGIVLPKNPELRAKRIKMITDAGGDRTNPNYRSRAEAFYIEAAKTAGVNPIDVFDCQTGSWFLRDLPYSLGKGVGIYGNSILIYDLKSPTGIRYIEGFEYTFKDLNKKSEALIAIIGITKNGKIF